MRALEAEAATLRTALASGGAAELPKRLAEQASRISELEAELRSARESSRETTTSLEEKLRAAEAVLLEFEERHRASEATTGALSSTVEALSERINEESAAVEQRDAEITTLRAERDAERERANTTQAELTAKAAVRVATSGGEVAFAALLLTWSPHPATTARPLLPDAGPACVHGR